MIIRVQLLAFGSDGEVRKVEIPDKDYVGGTTAVLNAVFKYGQNDFQPQRHPSMSSGDVAELDGKFYMCCHVGWKEISAYDLGRYKALPRRERQFSPFVESPQ